MHAALHVYVLVCFSAKIITYAVLSTELGAGNVYRNDEEQDGPQIRGTYRRPAYEVTR